MQLTQTQVAELEKILGEIPLKYGINLWAFFRSIAEKQAPELPTTPYPPNNTVQATDEQQFEAPEH